MNRVQLIGNLGRDAETKTVSTGTLTTFAVATNQRWKDEESGEWKQRTEWHPVVAWGKLADAAAALKKGTSVFIEGELRSREYAKDNKQYRVSEIVATIVAPFSRDDEKTEQRPTAA